MLVQVWQVDLCEHLQLEAENAKGAFRQEVEHLAKLVLAEQRYQEPECVFFVLLQMHECAACNEIHSLRVAKWFSLKLAVLVINLEGRGSRKDPV